jgi:DNA-binding NtrC family response regulator
VKNNNDCPARLLLTVGEDMAQLLQQPGWLDKWDGEVIPARDTAAALVLIRQLSLSLILVSCDISSAEIVKFIREVRAISADAPLVIVSQSEGTDDAVRFIHAGASGHIVKPLDKISFSRLVEGLRREEDSGDARRKRLFCSAAPDGVEVVGQSAGAAKCLEMARLVSESYCNPILILGETGTGKELIARSAHWWRYGDFSQFVAVNCATLTANLMASELFGHVKGAFTGADRDKTGLFEEAENGSIFLDEISEMPLDLQAQLLRVIQERTFRKVGATRDTKCNATILASSNRDLLKEIQAGRFREDLYYRLAVLPITVPALRSEERRDDIMLLAEYFLESYKAPRPSGVLRFGRDAKRLLMQYHWPGNIRELRNVVERAIILERTDEILASSIIFDQVIEQARPAPVESLESSPQDFSLEAAEREFIQRALDETGWQRTRAAALLGITRATLYAKLKRYDIKIPTDGPPMADADGPNEAVCAPPEHSKASKVSENRTTPA